MFTRPDIFVPGVELDSYFHNEGRRSCGGYLFSVTTDIYRSESEALLHIGTERAV